MDLKDRPTNDTACVSENFGFLPHGTEIESAEAERRKENIISIIQKISPSDKTTISITDELINDLEYDSIKLIELSVSLEMEFDLPPISEEAAANIVTVNDIISLIEMMVLIKSDHVELG